MKKKKKKDSLAFKIFISFKHRNIFEEDSNIFKKYSSQLHTSNAKDRLTAVNITYIIDHLKLELDKLLLHITKLSSL